MRRRTDALRQAGIEGVTAGQVLALQALGGVVAGLAVVVVSRSLSVALCFAVFAFFAPTAIVGRLRARRQGELRDVWPEVVDNLVSAVRAGMSLPEAVGALGTRGPGTLRPAFAPPVGSPSASTG
jgi:tight adherence protein B